MEKTKNMKKTLKTFIPQVHRREMFTIILLVLELVIFSVISNNFLTVSNLESILRNSTDLAVVSIGMTMVMILAGIDISVGSSLGVVSIIVGWLLRAEVNPILIGLAAVSMGTVIGYLNGFLVTKTRIPPIIATLGTSNVLRALIFGMLGGSWLTGLPRVFTPFTRGFLLGIPIPIFLILFFYVLFWLFMTFVPAGRHIYAVGNSAEASQLSGINADRVKRTSFALLGALVGFSSLIYVGRLASVEITVGNDLAMSSIAAVVLGGTSVLGGKGSVVGTLAGVLFMAVMKNGIVLLGIPSLWEKAVVGLLIIVSVIIDILISRRAEKKQREQISKNRALARVENN